VIIIKRSIDIFKEEYEKMVFEDKAQEKAFHREFSDVPQPLREQLFKMFKKRPKYGFHPVSRQKAGLPASVLIKDANADKQDLCKPAKLVGTRAGRNESRKQSVC
jgi:hypothetical protein